MLQMDNTELKLLFESYSGEVLSSIVLLPESGSNRKYYRMKSAGNVLIGAVNTDVRENAAFFSLTEVFFKLALPVPEVYAKSKDMMCYLMNDLGDITLFSLFDKHQHPDRFSPNIISLYKQVLVSLIGFQTKAGKHVDYSVCYPRAAFDKQSMLWDLNYLKYYFLKLSDISFDEQKLEDDFVSFTDFLLEAGQNYFLYRDFQSRNIMIVNNRPYFIDYQGGRLGALQYDLASLLYDAKADIPENLRQELLDFYLSELTNHADVSRSEFLKHYNAYAGIRIMQALGAYGFRGLYEKKMHFVKSIPYALKNLRNLLTDNDTWNRFPHLYDVLSRTCEHWLDINKESENGKLKVMVHSFSYKKSIPIDLTDNGGGFVFDCRALPNPGRYPEYQNACGLDREVISFLQQRTEVEDFVDATVSLVMKSVENYKVRGFTNLKVCYGCTGGQHRSVYAASRLYEYLKNVDGIEVYIKHENLPNK